MSRGDVKVTAHSERTVGNRTPGSSEQTFQVNLYKAHRLTGIGIRQPVHTGITSDMSTELLVVLIPARISVNMKTKLFV